MWKLFSDCVCMSSAISLNVTNTKTIPGTFQCDISIYLAHRWNTWKNRLWIITKWSPFCLGLRAYSKLVELQIKFSVVYMIESCHFVIAALASVFFIDRKRSLGQGNIFAPVCHSVHRGGGLGVCLSAYHPQDQTPPGTMHPPWAMHPTPLGPGRYGQRAGCTHPTGMQSCFIFFQNHWRI